MENTKKEFIDFLGLDGSVNQKRLSWYNGCTIERDGYEVIESSGGSTLVPCKQSFVKFDDEMIFVSKETAEYIKSLFESINKIDNTVYTATLEP